MIERIKNRRGCLLVLFLLYAVQMLMHLNVDNILLDDHVFFGVLDGGGDLLAFFSQRWQGWSSRLLIEGVLAVITHSIWAFRVLDSAVMVLMAWSLCRLANAENRVQMLLFSSTMVTTIPFAVLRSTGWMATSLNYYWPLAATLTALIPLADALWQRETSRPMLLVAVICAVFGANQEQTSAVIMGSYLVLGGTAVMLREKRFMPTLTAIFLIGAVELVLHLTCPGNAQRARESIAVVNLRDYGQFTLIDKLSIGLTSTTALLFFTVCPVLLACGAGIAGSLVARRRSALSLTPIATLALVQGWRTIAAYLADGAMDPFARYGTYVLQLGPERIQWAGQMEMMLMIVVLLGLMALTLYLSIGHRPLSAVCVFVFAVGFAARMALSFSPTVVESGERTMLPLYGAMMLCSLLCLRDCEQEGVRRLPLWAAQAAALVIAGMNVLSSFALAA